MSGIVRRIRGKFNQGINSHVLKVFCNKDNWPLSHVVFTPRLESYSMRLFPSLLWLWLCLLRDIPEPTWSLKQNSAGQGSPDCFTKNDALQQSQELNTNNKAATPGDVLSSRPFISLEKLTFKNRAHYGCSLTHFKTSTEHVGQPQILLDGKTNRLLLDKDTVLVVQVNEPI